MKFSLLPRAGTPGTDRPARSRTTRRATSGLLAVGVALVLPIVCATPAAACSPPEQWRDHPACTTTTQPPTTTTAPPETTTSVPPTTTSTIVVDTTTSTVPAVTSTTWHGETSTTSPGPVLSAPPAPGPGEPRLAETGPRESGRLAALGLVLLLSGVAAVTYAAKRKAVAS